MTEYPQLLHTVLDTTRPRELAEFYRQLLGLRYRPGDEPPADGAPDEADWLVLVDSAGVRKLAFQQVDHLTADHLAPARRPDAAARRFHGLEPRRAAAAARARGGPGRRTPVSTELMTRTSPCTCSQIRPAIPFCIFARP